MDDLFQYILVALFFHMFSAMLVAFHLWDKCKVKELDGTSVVLVTVFFGPILGYILYRFLRAHDEHIRSQV